MFFALIQVCALTEDTLCALRQEIGCESVLVPGNGIRGRAPELRRTSRVESAGISSVIEPTKGELQAILCGAHEDPGLDGGVDALNARATLERRIRGTKGRWRVEVRSALRDGCIGAACVGHAYDTRPLFGENVGE
jgi:hypothetical protein